MLSQDGTGGAEQLAFKPYKFKLVFEFPIALFFCARPCQVFFTASPLVRACQELGVVGSELFFILLL